MRRVIPVMAIVGALCTAGVIAQGRNFAGNWTVDVERTSAANAAAMSAGGGGGARGGRGAAGGTVAAAGTTGTIEQRTVTATGGVAVAGGGGGRGGAVGAAPAGAGMRSGPAPTVIAMDAGSFKIGSGENITTYKTDGSVQTITTARGEVKAKAAWKGDKLVIETTSEGPNGPLTSTNTWYLEGESLVRETNSTTPDGQTIARKTFFKKG